MAEHMVSGCLSPLVLLDLAESNLDAICAWSNTFF